MARPPIEIGIASEGKAFRQGIENDVIPPLEDAQQALLDLGKDGTKAGDKLEDSLRGAQKETQETKKDIARLADELEKSGRSGRNLGDGVKAGAMDAGDAVKEFGSEAKQNIAETFSSFRGESEDFAQVVQDTLGGVVTSLGPAGAIAGAVGAFTLGAVIGELERVKERTEEFKQKVSELAGELIDTSGVGETSIGYLSEKMEELASATDDGTYSLSQLRKDAKTAESSFEDLAQAMAGNVDGLDEIIKKEEEAYKDLTTFGKDKIKLSQDQFDAQKRIVDALKNTRDAVQEAADAEAAWVAAGGPALQAKEEAINSIQSELDEGIQTYKDFYNAESGAFDASSFISGMEARRTAVSDFNSNVQALADEFGLSFEETQAILDLGLDFAVPLQKIKESGLSAEFVAQVQAAVGGGQEIIDGTPLESTIDVSADTDTATSEIDGAAENRETTIEAKPKTAPAEAALDALAEKKRTATITAEADLSAARTALNDFVSQRRVAVVTVETRDREGKLVP